MRLVQLGVISTFVLIIFYLFYIHFGKSFEKSLKKDIGKIDPFISDPCVFLENDIATDNVYNQFGDKVSKNKKMNCSECGTYVYKGPDGCSPYQKDFLYSVRDNETGDNVGVCTSLSFPRECKFKSKNPPQNQ